MFTVLITMEFKQFMEKPAYVRIVMFLGRYKSVRTITSISRDTFLSYSYTYWCIRDMYKKGVVNVIIDGRDKNLSLIDHGRKIAEHLYNVENHFLKAENKEDDFLSLRLKKHGKGKRSKKEGIQMISKISKKNEKELLLIDAFVNNSKKKTKKKSKKKSKKKTKKKVTK